MDSKSIVDDQIDGLGVCLDFPSPSKTFSVSTFFYVNVLVRVCQH